MERRGRRERRIAALKELMEEVSRAGLLLWLLLWLYQEVQTSQNRFGMCGRSLELELASITSVDYLFIDQHPGDIYDERTSVVKTGEMKDLVKIYNAATGQTLTFIGFANGTLILDLNEVGSKLSLKMVLESKQVLVVVSNMSSWIVLQQPDPCLKLESLSGAIWREGHAALGDQWPYILITLLHAIPTLHAVQHPLVIALNC